MVGLLPERRIVRTCDRRDVVHASCDRDNITSGTPSTERMILQKPASVLLPLMPIASRSGVGTLFVFDCSGSDLRQSPPTNKAWHYGFPNNEGSSKGLVAS